jgi:hypothetical protein
MLKFGTEKELEAIKDKIPDTIYQAALTIIKNLDKNYGATRDVDENDGGFVLILENVKDIEEAADWYIRLDNGRHEDVTLVKCDGEDYLNVFSIINNLNNE